MISEIIKRLAYKKFETWDVSQEANYRWADISIKKILDGDMPLCEIDWALDVDDFQFLREEIKRRHGKVYATNHDLLHFAVKVNELLNCDNIRQAQELADKMAEQARRGMIMEVNYGI